MLLDPPLLKTVTSSRAPPLERDVLYGRPHSGRVKLLGDQYISCYM